MDNLEQQDQDKQNKAQHNMCWTPLYVNKHKASIEQCSVLRYRANVIPMQENDTLVAKIVP